MEEWLIKSIEWEKNHINPLVCRGGRRTAKRYIKYRRDRINQYPISIPRKNTKHVNEIMDNGYVVIPGFISSKHINALIKDFEMQLRLGTNLKESNIGYGFSKQVKDPLLLCKSVRNLAFSSSLVDIATEFFECMPGIGNANFRRSLMGDYEEAGNLQFHIDPNSIHFLKFFIYLNDVDINGGPFCYVKGSHKKRMMRKWDHTKYWPKHVIENNYGIQNIKYVTAKAGDLIIANTTGYHRGTKAINKERTMLTIDYGIHPERWAYPGFIDEDFYSKLDGNKKPLADFLTKS